MTWKELKEFCNSLPDNELTRKVILWREDEAVNNIDAVQLDEDFYADEEELEEGCFRASDASKPIEELTKVYEKGTPVLMENF